MNFGGVLWFRDYSEKEVKYFATKEELVEWFHNTRMEYVEGGYEWNYEVGIATFVVCPLEEIEQMY